MTQKDKEKSNKPSTKRRGRKKASKKPAPRKFSSDIEVIGHGGGGVRTAIRLKRKV